MIFPTFDTKVALSHWKPRDDAVNFDTASRGSPCDTTSFLCCFEPCRRKLWSHK